MKNNTVKPVATKPVVASKSTTKPATKPAPTTKQTTKPAKQSTAKQTKTAKPLPTTRKKPQTQKELTHQHNRQHNAAELAWLKIYPKRIAALPNTAANKAKRTEYAEKLKALQLKIKREKIVSLSARAIAQRAA